MNPKDGASHWKPSLASILVDVTPLQSEHRFRGVGLYTRQLVAGLIARMPEVQFAASRWGREQLPELIVPHTVWGYRGHRPAQVYWMYNEWFLREIIARTRPRLFHATDFNGTIRPAKIPTVATLYDLTALKQGLKHHGLSQRLSDLRWTVYYRHKLPRVDHLIAISHGVKIDAVNLLGIPPEQITVIPLGVDVQSLRPAVGAGPYNDHPPYFLFVGGADPNKNLPRILQAFSHITDRYPEIFFYFAGNWRTPDIQWLARSTTDIGISARVRHLGFVPQDDLASLYANAISFVFPSLEEGFGLPVLEAMACGCPVITSNRSVLAEVAGSAARLVDPENVDALVQALEDMLSSAITRQGYSAKGLQRVKEFTWDKMVERTIAVYQDVL